MQLWWRLEIKFSDWLRYCQITTFTTHASLYRFKRLNYCTNSAAEIFQNALQQVLHGIDGVLNIADDILVYGATREERKKALK